MSDSKTIIEAPDRAEIAKEHTGLVERAKVFRVENKTDHEDAQLVFRELRAAERKVRDRLDPIVDAAHKAHKGLTTLRSDILAPITEAAALLSRKVLSYEAEEQRKAAEVARIAQEAMLKAEQERKIREAVAAEESGDKAGAEEILNEPVNAPTIVAQANVAKVAGVSTQTRWRAEITDLKALVEYVAKNSEWINLILPNETALNKLAQAQRDALAIPGVKAVSEKILTGRAV